MRTRFFLVGTGISICVSMLLGVDVGNTSPRDTEAVHTHVQHEPEHSMLFTGDIMLGRDVERIMEREGSTYPFSHLEDMLREATVTVGNFEGTIPRTHVSTPDFGMRFSMQAEVMGVLHGAGFDVLSLANNHAYDYGVRGYRHTKSICTQYAVRCIGHPNPRTSLTAYIEIVGDIRVALLPLHVLGEVPDLQELASLLGHMRTESDVQVVYVHWGDEYRHEPNETQTSLAHYLIDSGIDAVIGHHPHVMQSIELYNGKPIFYSLGNLIFDQYFSDAVQEGYMVRMVLDDTSGLHFALIPYSSAKVRAQPVLMEGDDRTRVLTTLLENIPDEMRSLVDGAFMVKNGSNVD